MSTPVWQSWLRAMRLGQWSKNLLLLVPALTSHTFETWVAGRLALALLAFGLVASATYMLNDIRDREADRLHPRKRFRPFAARRLSVTQGYVAMALLLGVGLSLASLVTTRFLLIVVAYLALTIVYSLWLKALVLVDVFTLAALYSVRIMAGAAAIETGVSAWLLAFSSFMFYSLALIKRDAELSDLARHGNSDAIGRDYHVSDYPMLSVMGIVSGYLAVLVLALFINTPSVQQNYSHPFVLGLLCPIVLYWISRLWLKNGRGQMLDDPILWCVKDRVSWLVLVAMIAVTLAAL